MPEAHRGGFASPGGLQVTCRGGSPEACRVSPSGPVRGCPRGHLQVNAHLARAPRGDSRQWQARARQNGQNRRPVSPKGAGRISR